MRALHAAALVVLAVLLAPRVAFACDSQPVYIWTLYCAWYEVWVFGNVYSWSVCFPVYIFAGYLDPCPPPACPPACVNPTPGGGG